MANDGDRNAGTQDSTFSVENGNVVVTYGQQLSFDGDTRY